MMLKTTIVIENYKSFFSDWAMRIRSEINYKALSMLNFLSASINFGIICIGAYYVPVILEFDYLNFKAESAERMESESIPLKQFVLMRLFDLLIVNCFNELLRVYPQFNSQVGNTPHP